MFKPITIAGINFPRRGDAVAHCQAILYRGERDTEIVGDDADFVRAILAARPDKMAEIGKRKVVRFWRDTQPPPLATTACFWAELEDGTRIDFSFMKAIENIVAVRHPPHQFA